jgi:hypothetical protein
MLQRQRVADDIAEQERGSYRKAINMLMASTFAWNGATADSSLAVEKGNSSALIGEEHELVSAVSTRTSNRDTVRG